MHWVLQNSFFNEDAYQELHHTLERFDIPYSVHKVVPFIGELQPAPELNTKNVICIGSYSMRHVAKKFEWAPGVFDLEPFDFRTQLKHWGSHMLNRGAVIATFENAKFLAEECFIRPIQDSKVFPGKIMGAEEFYSWQKQVVVLKLDFGSSLTNDTLIQICPVKKIFSEHRFWVVAGKIVTSSTYKTGRTVHYQPVTDDRYQKYAEERIAEWKPLDTFVIDIADTEDGLKIVEINTLNSCGFYACDIQKLVMSLEEAYSEPEL